MKLILKTAIPGKAEEIFEAFDQQLFRYLLPPGASLIRFDGSRPGDIVHLKLPIVGDWISEITVAHSEDNEFYFIDEGRKLPLGMKFWLHKHVVRQEKDLVIIEDRIEYSLGNTFIDALAYPILYAAFAPRKKQYKKYFGDLKS